MKAGIPVFGIATLTPAVLLGVGAVFGGVWILAAVIYLTAMVSILDRVIAAASKTAAGAANTLPVLIALSHFVLLPLCVWALSAHHLAIPEKAGLFFAAGIWFGQVSNANAHELIHRSSRLLRRLGMWCYITILFGHHTSAHLLVHHPRVGTKGDPNTSRKGETLYRYLVRAWVGSFLQGYLAERRKLAQTGRAASRNPYVTYIGGGIVCLMAVALVGGPPALLAYLALSGYAQLQLLMSDYVQHYGLVRVMRADGKPEPVAAQHSWNSPHWFSSTMLLNATRHSDHHSHPARAYPALSIPDGAPLLPRPLPVMAAIALVPPLWRKIMDPRVDRWRNA